MRAGRVGRRRVAALVAVACSTALVAVAPQEAPAQEPDPPNVIIVMTDDMRLDSLDALPWLSRHAKREGARFVNAYAPLPQCCPSRTSVLTGRYVHNHDVWKSAASDRPGARGGHAGVIPVEDHTIATWLDDAGYATALVGKYANGYPAYTDVDGKWRVPPGWDVWASIFQPEPIGETEPGGGGELPELPPSADPARSYTSFTLARGGAGTTDRIDSYRTPEETIYRIWRTDDAWREIQHVTPEHSTRRYSILARSAAADAAAEPFFMWLNYTAPHLPAAATAINQDAEVELTDRTVNGFIENDATEEELIAAGKPAWVRSLPSMTSYSCEEPYSSSYKCADSVTSVAMEVDQRRTLLDVDREMKKLFAMLETTLDEDGRPLVETTYVIFTSDHGFMWGEHRIPHSKGVPYEESIAVPFLVFGPGVEPGKRTAVVSLIDIVPTIVDWAGLDRASIEAAAGIPMDGESLAGLIDGSMSSGDFTNDVRGGVLIESKRRLANYAPAQMNMPGWHVYVTTRWKVIRYQRGHDVIVGDPEGIFREGYDLIADPYELHSLYADAEVPGGLKKTNRVVGRMKTCSGVSGPDSCSIPASERVGGG